MVGAEPVELTVAAAADLSSIEKSLKDLGAAQTPPIRVRFVFGSSGQLASQIRAGAPYDVFLPANIEYARGLEGSGRLVVGSVRPFARGRLALYSKSGTVRSLADLKGDAVRRIAIANPAHAPYGVAARQALAGLGEAKLVFAENVRQALQFAESGNADAALVAWPLVKGRPGAVLLPESAHGPIVQGAAALIGERGAEALRFIELLLLSRAGQAILTEAGFGPPPGKAAAGAGTERRGR